MPLPPISFEVLTPAPADGATRARLGRLTTPHGTVETPVFMPVGTNATVKALDPGDLEEVGAQIILCNTYHLYLRPGHERVERLGGLHRFMAWDRPILTDSGGYQVVSLGDMRSIDDDGVTFRSHLDGSTHRFTPEHAIAVQEALGSDIAVCLDQPVPPHSSDRATVAEAVRRTHDWAERCLSAHTRPDQALFGIIQGGLEADLRAESTRAITAMPFDGICIGGLAGDETPAQRRAALDVCVPLLADDPRPRYLMGLGSPLDLLDAVDAGIDMFDSVLPARIARNGTVLVPEAAGVLSALGLALCDERRDTVRSLVLPIAEAGELPDEGEADVRYLGQSFELTVPLGGDIAEAFHRAHQERYGYADRARPLELVALRTAEVAPGPLYRQTQPQPSHRPAEAGLVELDGSTVWIPPGWAGTRRAGSLVVTRA